MKEKRKIAQGLSVWAFPTTECAKLLDQHIHTLADKYGGPVFKSHLTLHSFTFEDFNRRDEYLRLLPQVLRQLRCFRLPVKELVIAADYYRNVILRLDDSAGVVSDAERKLSRITSFPYPLDPHLSLHYGNISSQEKSSLEQSIELPGSIEFDNTALIYTAPNFQSYEERVSSWEILWRSDRDPSPR